MTDRTNPVLFPASADRAGIRFNPTRLGVGAEELRNAAYGIAATLLRAGYYYPPHPVIDAHARLESTDAGILVSFPPPTPTLGDTVTVIDPDGNSRELDYTYITADTLGHAAAELWFDLYTGTWVTFSSVPLPAGYGTRYCSHALTFPIPGQEAPSA